MWPDLAVRIYHCFVPAPPPTLVMSLSVNHKLFATHVLDVWPCRGRRAAQSQAGMQAGQVKESLVIIYVIRIPPVAKKPNRIY